MKLSKTQRDVLQRMGIVWCAYRERRCYWSGGWNTVNGNTLRALLRRGFVEICGNTLPEQGYYYRITDAGRKAREEADD